MVSMVHGEVGDLKELVTQGVLLAEHIEALRVGGESAAIGPQ